MVVHLCRRMAMLLLPQSLMHDYLDLDPVRQNRCHRMGLCRLGRSQFENPECTKKNDISASLSRMKGEKEVKPVVRTLRRGSRRQSLSESDASAWRRLPL